MQLKIHESYRKILALADTNLIGKTFTQDNKQIEVRPNFFQGEEITPKQALEILKNLNKEDATFNIVGKESVQTALKAGIITKEGIMKIDNIPIALGLM